MCADLQRVYYARLRYHATLLRRCAGCEKTTIMKCMSAVIKIKKILLFVGINKVMSTNIFVESKWYVCTSRCSRNRTSQCSKKSIKDFRYKNSECMNIKMPSIDIQSFYMLYTNDPRRS